MVDHSPESRSFEPQPPLRLAYDDDRRDGAAVEDNHHWFTLGAGGDVLAARACAEALLRDVPRPPRRLADVRLILTAACLHLYPCVGPDPTLADLRAFLVSLAHLDPGAWRAIEDSPLALVQYTTAELRAGRSRQTQANLSSAIEAVEAKLDTAL